MPRALLVLLPALLGLLAPAACASAAPAGTSAAQSGTESRPDDDAVTRIAFGSCLQQERPQPVWQTIAGLKPELLILAGDNVYADSDEPAVIRAAYDTLARNPGFAALREQVELLAVWDDHDYGADDAGAGFTAREASQQILLDFLDVPADDPRRDRKGVWHARSFDPDGRRVQVILLDIRYHRSPHAFYGPGARPAHQPGPYAPNEDADATILGAAQWAWLEERLREPAELRILVSSIQVLAEQHGWESWSRYPHERARLLRLLAETRAAGVVLLSGDRHHAELSRLPSRHDGLAPDYPLWEVTSSALNQTKGWGNELNDWRVGDAWFGANFGMLEVDWDAADGPAVELRVHREDGKVLMRETVALAKLQPAPEAPVASAERLERIAFGSCNQQNRPTPLWEDVLAADPQRFLFLGDNVYADTRDPAVMQAAYDALAAQPGFAALREQVPIHAVWDDHDYGWNDADRTYPMKEASRRIMLDFFGTPTDSPRRTRDGIYHSWLIGPPGERVQIVLLDLRWNRTPWKQRVHGPEDGDGHPGGYAPDLDPDATMLGEAQWTWLEEQLRVPARVRLVCSSLQALSEECHWEGWAMMPRERQRLLDTIARSGAGGVLLLSGDTHWAELTRVDPQDSGIAYPLYELTSSGLNQGWEFTQITNPHRVGLPYWQPNWGLVRIDWEPADPVLHLQAIGEDEKGIRFQVPLSRLQPR